VLSDVTFCKGVLIAGCALSALLLNLSKVDISAGVFHSSLQLKDKRVHFPPEVIIVQIKAQ